LNGFGISEFNFDKGETKSNRNSALNLLNNKSLNEPEINHYQVKTNINESYSNIKDLILEIEVENSNSKDVIKITSAGLPNSKRTKKDENDNYVYFGQKSQNEEENSKIDYFLLGEVEKTTEISDKKSENEEAKKNLFFRVYYNFDMGLYYIKDMGGGYGTFYKIEEEIIIKEKSLVNIGETYLLFSFNKGNKFKDLNDDDLIIKVYSNKIEEQIVVKNTTKEYLFGRAEKCDFVIEDKMLSRIHCIIYYLENNWYIKDGNATGQESTNGTWIFLQEDMEIKEGMKFKSNNCTFNCKFD
jgi:hypothetical protein